MIPGRGLSAGVLLSVLAVAACTPSPAPLTTLAPLTSTPATSVTPVTPVTPAPSTTSAPVTTPSTVGTVTATAIPTSAPSGDNSEAAAIATAEAFLGASNLATVQQDLGPVQALALPSCACIANEADSIQLQKERKHRVQYDDFGPVKLVLIKHQGSLATVRVSYVRPTFRSLDTNHKVVATNPPRPMVVDISMQYVGDAWKVAANLDAS